MAYRKIDERVSRLPRLPRGRQNWLREIFVEDLGLKLLALAITLGLWFAVAGQRAPATIRLRGVQLAFRVADEMEISNNPREEVEIILTGSKRALDQINVRDLIASVDVTNFKSGERVVQLTRQSVKMELPDGVRLDGVEPNSVPLRLEPRVERELEVEARIEGRVPDGFELRGWTASPAKVKVRGPISHVNALLKAPTETIPLDGHRESFNDTQTAIDISDEKVDVLDSVVNVHLEIGEKRVEKSFAGVTVRDSSGAQEVRPNRASVTLYGPGSVLQELRVEDIQIVLDAAADGSITPRLVLPSGIGEGIELRSTKPSGFTIVK